MKLRKLNKKAQVSTMTRSIVTLGIAAIVLVLIMLILQETRDTDVLKKSTSEAKFNETLTTVDDLGEFLEGTSSPGANGFTISLVTNASDGVIINSANYTLDGNGLLRFSDAADNNFNNTDWNVTYSYSHGGSAFAASNQTLVGMGTFGDFWTIIVLAIVAAIVIGIIFTAFGGIVGRNLR